MNKGRVWALLFAAALLLGLGGCSGGTGGTAAPEETETIETAGDETPTGETSAGEGATEEAPAEKTTEEPAPETEENAAPTADAAADAEGEVIPGVSAAFLPELNGEIARQYDRLLTAAEGLGFAREDILANQVAETDMKLVQIIARKAGDDLHTVQIRIYGKGEQAAENFDLLAYSAEITGGEVLAEEAGEIAVNTLQMTDPDSGEALSQQMASILDDQTVISCTAGDRVQALEDLRGLLAAE